MTETKDDRSVIIDHMQLASASMTNVNPTSRIIIKSIAFPVRLLLRTIIY